MMTERRGSSLAEVPVPAKPYSTPCWGCANCRSLILLEDTAELAPQHEQVIALKTRAANSEGVGEMLGELIVQALRMGRIGSWSASAAVRRWSC